MNRWTKWVGRLAVAITAVAATAGAQADVVTASNGVITGVNEVQVEIDGSVSTYNVTFDDVLGAPGSFLTQSLATTLTTALYDQYIAGPNDTKFDKIPASTNGCGYSELCIIVTPYLSTAATGTFNAIRLQNGKVNSAWADVVISNAQSSLTTSVAVPSSYYTVAHWTQVVTAVPEPESYAMLLAGLGLMGTIARRRKTKRA